MTLAATSHLFLSPIKVITDSASEDVSGYTAVVTPPDIISTDAWGAPVFLVNYMDRHFEGTHPIPQVSEASASAVKQEIDEIF